MAHPELGRKILDDVIETVGPIAKIENQARMEGRSMTLVLSPDKKAQDAIKKAAAEAEKQKAREAVPAEEPSESTQASTVDPEPAPPETPGDQ